MDAAASQAYAGEIALGCEALRHGEYVKCFFHLERAHVLGQRSTLKHVYAHWLMLSAGLRQRDLREVLGQLPRMLAALLSSHVWVPRGNTGRARVSAFAPMPIPTDLQHLVS